MPNRDEIKTRFRGTCQFLLALTVLGCSAAERDSRADSAEESTTQVVRQIDHILIETTDANALFVLLSETLQLPVAWPMYDYGGFASGGIALGNVNLEILRSSEAAVGAVRSRFVGVALEPAPLRFSLPELKARGIRYGRPAPYTSIGTDGSATTPWTTVGLPSVSHETTSVFLCAYARDVAETRRQSLAQLRSRNGGPLSVQSVKELVYGATDATQTQRQWRALLSPVEALSPGVWPIGDGPAIRIVPASENGMRGLVIHVESLAQARQFLSEHGLLGAERPGELTIGGPILDGLQIALMQAAGV